MAVHPFLQPGNEDKLKREYLAKRKLELLESRFEVYSNSYAKVKLGGHYNLADRAAGRSCLFIPYLGPDGKPLPYRDDPTKDFGTLRFLGEPQGPPPFGEKKHAKGLTPNGKGTLEMHFEPINDSQVNWMTLPDGFPFIICESAVKAMCISLHCGIPCIGLCGTYTWTSKDPRDNGNLLAHYPINLQANPCIVVYDAGVALNDKVLKAREALMFSLYNNMRICKVSYVDLPLTEEGEDQGPDDFIAKFGPQAFIDLIGTAKEYKGRPFGDLIEEVNKVAVFNMSSGGVIYRPNKIEMKKTAIKDLLAPIHRDEPRKNSKVVDTVFGYDVWLKHESRAEVDGMKYKYLGEAEGDDDEFLFPEGPDGPRFYNSYRRDGAWPAGEISEDAQFVIDTFNRVLGPKAELVRSYFSFLKFKTAKPTSFMIMFSEDHGVGKGWITKLGVRLIGKSHAGVIRTTDFVKDFNASLANKRFVVLHEFKAASIKEKQQAMENIKTFIGDEDLSVERKGFDSYVVENCAGMAITCNDLSALPNNTIKDRRMWYVNCVGGVGITADEWTRLHGLLESRDVMNEVAVWLRMAEFIDFSTWRPPLDEEKMEAIRESADELTSALMGILSDLRDKGFKAVSMSVIKGLASTEVDINYYGNKRIGLSAKRAGFIATEVRTTVKDFGLQTPIYLTGLSRGSAGEDFIRAWALAAEKAWKGSKSMARGGEESKY